MGLSLNALEKLIQTSKLGNATKENYIADLHVFVKFIETEMSEELSAKVFEKEFLEAYFNYVTSRQSITTSRRHLSALRKVSYLMVEHGYLEKNHAKEVVINDKEDITVSSDLNRGELKFLMDFMRRYEGPRKVLVISLSSNLRLSLNDIIKIRLKDFKMMNGDVVLCSNGRWLPLVGPLLIDFMTYIEIYVCRKYYLTRDNGVYSIVYNTIEYPITEELYKSIQERSKSSSTALCLAKVRVDGEFVDIDHELNELIESELMLDSIYDECLFSGSNGCYSYHTMYNIMRKISDEVDIRITSSELHRAFDERVNVLSGDSFVGDYFKSKKDYGDMLMLIYPKIKEVVSAVCI